MRQFRRQTSNLSSNDVGRLISGREPLGQVSPLQAAVTNAEMPQLGVVETAEIGYRRSRLRRYNHVDQNHQDNACGDCRSFAPFGHLL